MARAVDYTQEPEKCVRPRLLRHLREALKLVEDDTAYNHLNSSFRLLEKAISDFRDNEG